MGEETGAVSLSQSHALSLVREGERVWEMERARLLPLSFTQGISREDPLRNDQPVWDEVRQGGQGGRGAGGWNGGQKGIEGNGMRQLQ